MIEPYSYPDELYCDQCHANVKVKILERTAKYDDRETGRELTVHYKAAVCPVCGNTLCERDQEIAFVNMVSKGGSEKCMPFTE